MAAIGDGASQELAIKAAEDAWRRGSARPSSPPSRAPEPGRTQPATSQRSAPTAPTPTSPGLIRGRVAGFQQRNELRGRRYLAVWDFRVERASEGPIAVEMRGYSFDGAIANGDEVEMRGSTRSGKVVYVRSVDNLTSNSRVRVTSRPHPLLGMVGWGVKLFVDQRNRARRGEWNRSSSGGGVGVWDSEKESCSTKLLLGPCIDLRPEPSGPSDVLTWGEVRHGDRDAYCYPLCSPLTNSRATSTNRARSSCTERSADRGKIVRRSNESEA